MNKAFELLNITLFTVLGLMPIPRGGEGGGGPANLPDWDDLWG